MNKTESILYVFSCMLVVLGFVFGIVAHKHAYNEFDTAYIFQIAHATYSNAGMASPVICAALLNLLSVAVLLLSSLWAVALLPAEAMLCARGALLGFYACSLFAAYGFKGILIATFGMIIWAIPLICSICIVNIRVIASLYKRIACFFKGKRNDVNIATLFAGHKLLFLLGIICDCVISPLLLRLLIRLA